MKIQKFLTPLVAAICSCESAIDTPQLPGNVKTDIAFTLSVTDLSYDSAQISVKHDGSTDDTWYGFLTDQTDKNIAVLIASKVAELQAKGGNIEGLESRTSKRINLKDTDRLVFGQ